MGKVFEDIKALLLETDAGQNMVLQLDRASEDGLRADPAAVNYYDRWELGRDDVTADQLRQELGHPELAAFVKDTYKPVANAPNHVGTIMGVSVYIVPEPGIRLAKVKDK